MGVVSGGDLCLFTFAFDSARAYDGCPLACIHAVT